MSLTIRLLNYLARQSRLTVWLITAASLAGLGFIDYFTGTEVVVTFFYLLPVSLASWALGKTAGRMTALSGALIMLSAQALEEGVPNAPILLWNTAVRLGVFLVVADLISEFRHLLKLQTELSRTDPLTSILNRRAFQEAGEAELHKMNGAGHPVTIAFMDIDDFKNINDAWGHSTGDALLICVAECLRSQVWGTDAVARLGGDEYALLLPRTDAIAAQRVLARLKDTLSREMTEAHWPVTFSIGAVTCLDSPPGIEELLHQADQLMYRAKRRGKNRIEYGVYPEALNPERYDDPDLEHLPQAPEVPSFHS